MCERGQGHRVIKPLLHARESCACRKITCVASATNGAEERRESLRTSEPRPADARSRPAATERTRVAQVAPVSRTSGLGGEQGQKMGTTRPLRAANFSSRDRPAHSRSRVTLTTPWIDTVPLSRTRCAERPRGAPASVSFEFKGVRRVRGARRHVRRRTRRRSTGRTGRGPASLGPGRLSVYYSAGRNYSRVRKY